MLPCVVKGITPLARWFVAMLLVAACALLAGAGAFNLDVEYATVFSDPEDQFGSYFGFTVSLLKETGADGGSWLLVGAPRGNSTYPKQNSINQPGVVYQCKLGEKNEACKSLVLDSKGESRVSRPNGYSYYDKKEQALVGSTLEVEGAENGNIVVCGPRWKNQFYDLQPMNGICYWLNGSKDFDNDAGKLIPLVLRYEQGFIFEDKYGVKRDPKEVFYYIYGGAGVSVNFVKNSTEMIIGAPGVFDWMGTIIRYRDNTNRFTPSNAQPRLYTKAFIPNPYSIKLPSNKPEKFTYGSYLGYSVGSGRFISSSDILYVGGAPRAGKLKGMVFIFDFPEQQNASLIIKIELEGFQMGEYFGSSLCVVDLNSDGLDDLVVGAPQHSLLTSSALPRAGDEGRIYVFINHDNGIMKEIGEKTKIMGSQEQGARFGTSISNIGDLNSDGYPDIAVGAPYENAGHGAVYIYHGRSEGINPKYAQCISAQDISPSLLGFGFSISRGSDVDGNNCLDLAVGAYESGNAVIFKSRPVIIFNANLATNVRRITFDTIGFRAKACLSYSGKHIPDTAGAEVTLKADSTYGRARFILDSTNASSYTYKLALNYEAEQCKEFDVEITTIFQDFSKPIEITMEYKLSDKREDKDVVRRDGREFCNTCPVVDPSIPSYVTHKVPYATGCGDDDICKTDIKTDVSFVDIISSFVIGSKSKMKMKVIVKNTGEPAFLSYTNITIPSITPLVRVPKNCKEVSFSSNSSSDSGLQCDMGNPLSSNKSMELILELDTKNIPSNSERLIFEISSDSTGEEVKDDDNFKEIILPLRTISDIAISGKSSQDHFHLIKKDDSTPEKDISFSHIYEVHNFGPSPVNKLNLTFNIPIKAETSSGSIEFVKVYQPQAKLDSQQVLCIAKGFKFYTDKNMTNGSGIFIESSGHSETREIKLDEGSGRKKRISRDTHYERTPSLSSLQDDKTFFVKCSSPGIECMTVECIVGPFQSVQTRAVIVFPFKLSPKALEPVLEDKDLILISSSGQVEVFDFHQPIQPDDDRPDFVDVYTFVGKLPESRIAAWIVALAVIGGLLILLLLILGLIKMGFFKRDKKEELENLKHKSEMEESLTNDTDD